MAATNNDAPPALTLELGADTVSSRDFLRVVRAFTGLLGEIAEEACGDGESIHWEISVSEGSLLIAADLPPTVDAAIAGRVRAIMTNPPSRIRSELNGFPRLEPVTRLLTGEERRDILREEHPEPDRHPSQDAEYDTVEGILDTLSSRGQVRFTISEPIWNMGVRCTVPDDLVDNMQGMWRQRVAAHGMVHYDRNGLPTSIRAEEVELFPYDETPIEAYRGLYPAD